MTATLLPALNGFGFGAGLIVAIGAQNAFVLRQGLRREHVFVVASLGFLCDAALIVVGAAGFGALVASSPTLTAVAAWGGAAFLFAYGLRSLRAALRPSAMIAEDAGRPRATVWRAAAAMLAFSVLNPHVYLDTVVLLGSLAAQYPEPERAWFALGAVAASGVWFYGLGYGAGRLAPLFRSPAAWRALDLAIAAVMWAIAAGLVWPRLG